MTTAKFSDILDGYELCAFGDHIEIRGFVSLERGTVHIVSDDLALEEKPPEDLDSGLYLTLPDKSELGLGRDLVFEFAKRHLPDDAHVIKEFFRKRGAYSKFKNLLERKGQLQAWFDYENTAKEARLREWCVGNGIDLL